MHPALSRNGYLRIALETYDENGKFICRTNESIHRLVAETFIPNPNNLPVVMHLDNDKLNNHVSNLKWGSCQENSEQAANDGLYINTNPFRVQEYEIYNDSNRIRCGGYDRVSKITGYAEQSVPALVRSRRELTKGEYKGCRIRETGRELIRPIIFRDKSKINV